MPDSDGLTLLHIAVQADDRYTPIVETLIENGADVNAALKSDGNTPLHIQRNLRLGGFFLCC